MVYGYIRVSTDRQDTENQKLGINEKAEKLNLAIDEWIADDGVSGTKEPEDRLLGKLLKKIKPDDVIIASELSRLGRKLFMIMRILEHCMKVGAKVYTVKDGYELGDNIQSKVLAFAFGLAAEIERDMISQRTLEGLKRKKLMGVLLGCSRGSKEIVKVGPDRILKMKELLDSGLSVSRIAEKMKLHRMTVGYHLAKNGHWKGRVMGYKIITKDSEIEVNSQNCFSFGFTYGFIKNAARQPNENLKLLGIERIEPIFDRALDIAYHEYYAVSDHPELDRTAIIKHVESCMTLPEIHNIYAAKLDYFTIYDYVSGDTELNMLYRQKGHLRVKTVKN